MKSTHVTNAPFFAKRMFLFWCVVFMVASAQLPALEVFSEAAHVGFTVPDNLTFRNRVGGFSFESLNRGVSVSLFFGKPARESQIQGRTFTSYLSRAKSKYSLVSTKQITQGEIKGTLYTFTYKRSNAVVRLSGSGAIIFLITKQPRATSRKAFFYCTWNRGLEKDTAITILGSLKKEIHDGALKRSQLTINAKYAKKLYKILSASVEAVRKVSEKKFTVNTFVRLASEDLDRENSIPPSLLNRLKVEVRKNQSLLHTLAIALDTAETTEERYAKKLRGFQLASSKAMASIRKAQKELRRGLSIEIKAREKNNIEEARLLIRKLENSTRGILKIISLARAYRVSLDGVFKLCTFVIVNRSDKALSANFQEPLREIYKEYAAIREVESSTIHLKNFLGYGKKKVPPPTPKVAKERDAGAIRLVSFQLQLNEVKIKKLAKEMTILDAGEKTEQTLTKLISLANAMSRLEQEGKRLKRKLEDLQ